MLINQVYEGVLGLSNKEQVGGYLRPTRFSTYCAMAQYDVIDELYALSGINKNAMTLLSDVVESVSVPVVQGVVSLPDDYYKYVDANALFFSSEGEQVYPVDYISNSERGERQRSKIVRPDNEYPVATETRGAINILPKTVSRIELIYVVDPPEPVFSTTGVPPVFDPNTSVDFTLSIRFKNILIRKVCQYFGLEVRDAMLIQATVENMVGQA